VLKIYPHRVADSSIALWLSVLIAVAAVLAILLSPQWGFTPESDEVKDD